MALDKHYLDLFIDNQGKGKYQMFTFDIKDSKGMTSEKRLLAQYQIIELIERIYFDLRELEKLLDKQILIDREGYGNLFDKIVNDFAFRYEPFVFGDVVGITILYDSINPRVILDLFKKNKKEIGIDFKFHVAFGNYETDDYGFGGHIAFRGYALEILSNLHKSEYEYIRENMVYQSDLSEDERLYYEYLCNENHENAVINAEKYTYESSAKKLNLK